MSVKFKAVAKSNPQNRDEQQYYVQPIRKGTVSRAKLEEGIVRETSLSKADVRGVLITLSQLLGDYLTEGYSVKLEDVGIFSLRVQSNGSANEADVTAQNVKNVSAGFRVAPSLRKKIEDTKFEKE